MSTPFRIDALTAAGQRLGSGPLPNVREVNDTVALDEIGELTFSLPAAQPESALLTAGTMFDVYDPLGQGYLGRYHYSSRRLKASNDEALIEIKCYDEQIELTRDTVGFQRAYNNLSVRSVLVNLVGLVPGWTINVEPEFNTTGTILSLEGESPFRGIDELRDRFGHIRLAGPKTLEFGRFGASSGVRLVNLQGQVAEEIEANPEIAIVTDVTLVEEADDIYNSIIPLGTGHGEGVQLTIKEAGNAGEYPVRSRTNQNGTRMYYIQDAASVTAYGARWRVMSFPQIRPLDNSVTARARAALALKLTAETMMKRNLKPKLSLTIGDVQALRQTIRVGDKVRLIYKGVVDGYGYLSINEELWVMSVRRRRMATGERTVSLTVANTDDNRTSDEDVVLGIQRDIRALKVHVPTNPSLDRVTQTVRLRAAAAGKAAVNDQMDVPIGNETQSLLYAILRLKTKPLTSTVESAADESKSTGPSTVDTSGPSTDETSEATGGHGHPVDVGLGGDHGHQMIIKPTLNTPGGSYQTLMINLDDGRLYRTAPSGAPDITSTTEAEAHEHPGEAAEATDNHSHKNPHKHTFPHTHTVTPKIAMVYGLFSDNVYPGQVGVKINGIDRTAQLGGPWGTPGESVKVEVSITDILNNTSGGVRRRHTIEFYCGSGKGQIEAEVHMVASIQALSAY